MKGKILLLTLFLAGAGCWPVFAQGLLPSSFGGWTASGATTRVAPPQLEQLDAGNAAILREYGVASAERRAFSKGADSATVTLYSMTDPSAAFGAFTFLRDAQMSPMASPGAANFTAASGNRALLLVGNLVIEVSSTAQRPADADLDALPAQLLSHADRRPFPFIAGYLPPKGLIRGSERYVLGPKALAQVFPAARISSDWLGFGASAEAIVAHYHLAGEPHSDATLLVALYPTQQLAADHYGALLKVFALNEPGQTGGLPMVYGNRSSALIALLAGVQSRQVARNLLDQIHYETDVTWNEPSHDLTDPSISTMIVGAIEDTGTIMLLAMAAGLGFGGLRILTKFVLPGRVFDRTQQVEILQLGLSGKRIDNTGFYALGTAKREERTGRPRPTIT